MSTEFPDGFLWGGAVAAHQFGGGWDSGGKGPNVVDVLTAGAQGALAWYATELVGRAAERYLAAGKSWGERGAKRVVRDIVESLDRDSILREACDEILARLRGTDARR